MTFQLHISTGSPVPIYRQIMDQICHAIASGDLSPGDQLPSVRALAEQLVINPNTVARIYGELVREGIVEAQKGRGVFVASRRPVYTQAERLRRIERPLNALINEAVLLGFTPDEIRAALAHKLAALQLTPSSDGGNSNE